MTTRRLTIEVVIDSRKAADAMRAIEGEVKKFGGTVEQVGDKATKSLNKFGREVSSVGVKLTAGLTLPILAIGSAAIKMAADAAESENLFAVSFGSMADAARAWSETTADALRLNAFELRKQSGTIFVMVEAMGLAKQEAFAMATGITELAGDMASFFNLNTEEAFNKIRSGIVGETEGLRRLGILVDENTVKHVAYRAGIAEVGEELTQVQKVQARWLAIQEQTVKVTGDLARTLDSPANRLRGLKADIEQVAIRLGTALLPAFTSLLDLADKMVPVLDSVVGAFADMEPASQVVTLAFVAVAAAAGPTLFVTGQLIQAWAALIAKAPATAAAVRSVWSAMIAPAAVIASLLVVNEIIAAWGRASEAAMRYTRQQNSANELLAQARSQIASARQTGAAPILDASLYDALQSKIDQTISHLRDLGKEQEAAGRGWDWMTDRPENEIAQDIKDASLQLLSMREVLGKVKRGAEEAAGSNNGGLNTLSKKAADLQAQLLAATRQEEFLIAAFQRGEQEFRRAERVVAAYNAVIVDGEAQLSLFDEALKLEGLRTQRENLERLKNNMKEMEENTEAATRAWEEFLDTGLFTGTDTIAERDAARNPAQQRDNLGFTDAELEAWLDSIGVVNDELLKVLDTKGKILDTLDDWQGAAYSIADAFVDVDESLARVAASAGDFLGALQHIGEEGGKIGAVLAGLDLARSIGNAVTGPNNYGAEGAAAGAVIGALVGAYFTQSAQGAQAGAALGSAAGGALGSFIKKGVDEFLGRIKEAEGYAVGQAQSIRNSLSQIGKQFLDAISRGINDAVDALGGELVSLPQLDIKIRDGVYSVFSNGIVARFQSMQEAVDFAILQALRDGDIYGLSEEVRQALQNSTAESFGAMAQDLDFARWVENLPEIGDLAAASADALDAVVDQYRAALRKATQLGIDTAKIDQWFGATLQAIRNNILGIVETEEERIRRESEAFNREVQLLEAEQLARQADLLIKKSMLDAEVAIIQARLAVDKNDLQIRKEMLDVDIAINTAEWELLHSKLSALAAIDAALLAASGILANLPDLISEKDIQDAIRRGRGAGGGDQRKADQEQLADIFGAAARALLPEVARQLADVNAKWDDHAELAHGNAEALAEVVEARRAEIEVIRNEVRQSFYDAIAAAQGLSEVWGVLDRFRDLRQAVLDAGLSAEETAERLKGLDWAEGVEKQKIEIGIVDKLFGYLKEQQAFAGQSVEFAQMKVQLEFGIMKAQLQLLGVFDQYVEIFDAALAAALKAAAGVDLSPPPAIRDSFNDAARDAERIAESFLRAKQSVAEFLNQMLVGTFGGVSPVGGVDEARRQLDEVVRQAMTGNIGAIESFDDYGSTLLRLARDAYGSSPEFQAIYDYVLAAGRDIMGVTTGREGNLIFDERFYGQNETAIRQRDVQTQLMERIAAALERQERGWRGTPLVGQGVNP